MTRQRTEITEHNLLGLIEIRKAMEYVEELRRKGIDAKIEVEDKKSDQSRIIILHSFNELQEFISQLFTRMLVDGISSSVPLDDFEQIVSEVSTSLVDESKDITGKVIL